MLELSVAIRMVSPFARLGIQLRNVAHIAQQPPHSLAGGGVSFLRQGFRQMLLIFANPQKLGFRITTKGRLNNLRQGPNQPWLLDRNGLAAPAGAPNTLA